MRNLMNSIFSGFGRTLGRFLFYFLMGLLIYLIIGKWEVKAYTYIGYSSDGSSPSYIRAYESYSTLASNVDYWWIDVGQYQGIGNANGQYLTVTANYTLYLKMNITGGGDGARFSTYINNARNTLTSSNLRCGIGDYMQGYDGTYAPSIPSFRVIQNNISASEVSINIIFTYSQRRQQGSYTNTNASCWFVRVPTNGLYMQNIFGTSRGYIQYRSTIDTITFSLTADEQTELLQEQIALQQQTIRAITDLNGNVTIINNSINQVNNTLTDESSPSSSEANDFLDELRDIIPTNGTISNLFLLPIDLMTKILNGFNNQCTPLTIPTFNFGTSNTWVWPCVSLNLLLSDNLVLIIDYGLFIALFIMFWPTLINMWNTLIHLQDEFDTQYTPQHAKARTRMDRWS